ncbi:MAG: glycosyltransferase family 2 protein [Actinomycetota bacterium]|nr:glycosyltransferase family 2 protein [Actinomycetota bacterium]
MSDPGAAEPGQRSGSQPPADQFGTAGVTVVVVTWQGAHLLPDCLDSLAAQSVPCQVLVVDNASTDRTPQLLAERAAELRVLRLPSNTGFAGGVAAALPHVRTPFLALLNNDAAAEPDWLERSLAALADRPDTAAITSRLLTWPVQGKPVLINNAGVQLVRGGYGADRGLHAENGPPFDVPAEVFGFSGGAAVLRTAAVRAVGGMPAEFFLYYEDTDLAWRLRLAGWRVWYEPTAVVHHRHGASTDLKSDVFAFHTERNRLLMLLRCAPAGMAIAQLARFVLTTFSLQARRLAGQRVPDARVFSLVLRMRVFASVLRHCPGTIRSRRRITRSAIRSRQEVARAWVAG